MKNYKRVLGGIVAVVLMAAGLMMVSCAAPAEQQPDQQQKNQQYMSDVNQVMDALDTKLDSFTDAVSRQDIVGMRTQANSAYSEIDKLSSLSCPDELKDIQKNYVDGASKMREALDAYIDLYAEVESDSFNWSKYEDRLKEVQKMYDDGISSMKAGDEAAAKKQ